jgi:hypothetical protein
MAFSPKAPPLQRAPRPVPQLINASVDHDSVVGYAICDALESARLFASSAAAQRTKLAALNSFGEENIMTGRASVLRP